jgi:hypothetical protein
MTMTGRDGLHLAMGEFLTECSNLENILITLMIFCQNKRPFQQVHLEMLGETFGNRVRAFKNACRDYQFAAEHRQSIDEAIMCLDALLPRRNLIVHGITFEC